ncbi:Uncharacterised protein [Burkholderia pseudomallei]|nr:Uncharacterised protein [Burkholderia pseudomallei]CAJ8748527.1 Uncharacterised protein [Burkholderia pseudomallei]CAJ9145686.1 Uncharacterised protein [Burkholderia pseudomallei]
MTRCILDSAIRPVILAVVDIANNGRHKIAERQGIPLIRRSGFQLIAERPDQLVCVDAFKRHVRALDEDARSRYLVVVVGFPVGSLSLRGFHLCQ